MNNLKPKLILTAVVSAALVAGCGGGGDGVVPAPDISQSVSAALDFINNLIAGSSETGEPMDVSAVTLAVDDATEPASL